MIPAIGYYLTFVSDGFLKFKNIINLTTTAFKLFSTSLSLTTIKSKLYAFWQSICINTTKIWTFFKNLATSSLKRFNLITIATTRSSKLYTTSLNLGTIATKTFNTTTLFLSKAFNIAKIALRSFLGATGIGLLLVGASLIYEYWKPIKTFFLNFWDSIKIGFKDSINAILNIFISPNVDIEKAVKKAIEDISRDKFNRGIA